MLIESDKINGCQRHHSKSTMTHYMIHVWKSRTCFLAGDVVLWETYEKYVKPEGQLDEVLVGPKDVIELQKGGTGFAQHDGDSTQATKFWHLGPGSGKQDLRGQHQGAQSKGGLVFRN